MYLEPVSYDGFALNSSSYQSIIPRDAPASWNVGVTENKRTNAFPQFASLDMDGITLPVVIKIASGGSLLALKQVFDPSSYYLPVPKKLIVKDPSGGRWSVMAVAKNLIETSQKKATAMLRISQPVWVSETLHTKIWNVPGANLAITIDGNTWALPTLKMKPTGENTNNFVHNEPITVLNKTAARAAQFPLQIIGGWNTLALAGQIQVDCSDVRLTIDDVETDAWIVRPNTTNTGIWINANLEAKTELKLGAAIAATGDIGEVQFAAGSEAVLKKIKTRGAFRIGTEIYTYSGGVNPTARKVGGVQRSQRNTSPAAHAVGTVVYFIEHDVRLMWGNPIAVARVNDDSKKPAFDLEASDNTQWVFNQFGDKAQLMSASWKPGAKSTGLVSSYYTDEANEYDEIWPADVLGAEVNTYLSKGKTVGDTATITWDLNVPFGIYSVLGSGKKYRVGAKMPVFTLQKSVNGTAFKIMSTEGSPVNESTLTDFTIAELLTGASASYNPTWLRFSLAGAIAGTAGAMARVEMQSVTVKPVTGNVPTIVRGTDVANVQLQAAITNLSSRDQDEIDINYPAVTGKTLVIDTEKKIITYEGHDADPALGPYPTRGEWLPFLPGLNTLQFASTVSGPVEITVEYRERMIW
jgi:hypothetical protein